MTSTIKVNNVQNQCGQNIINENSNTITIGASGDTIALASGASQTGFGRTGTVDWQTGSIKTATFTAVSGEGYFVNTTAGVVTANLPASPSAGDIVSISDYANTSVTNNITVARNGSNIEGSASDLTIENNGIALTFVYVDGTRGWKVVNAGKEANKSGIVYIEATGGTITTSGDYKIHTFTGPGTFCVSCAGDVGTVDYLVVAGGGSGAGGKAFCTGVSGGGGAGGYRESSGTASGCYTVSPLGTGVSALPVTATGYPITVGGGGTPVGGSPPQDTINGTKGSNSGFSTITSAGGGGGRGGTNCGANPGPQTITPGDAIDLQTSGGSGGGGSYYVNTPTPGTPARAGGSGNSPPVSPPQGNAGGGALPGCGSSNYATGGGGGAGAPGTTATSGVSGAGGAGASSSITGSAVTRAGGGGGSGSPVPITHGAGGSGGGGAGGSPGTSVGSGTANTGGGGGAATPTAVGCTSNGNPSGAGGSGIVIIRYQYQ
jgi:hypothetical protein